MSRALLHRTKLEEFKQWLDAQGIQHRPPKGEYQALQIKMRVPGWACIYRRNYMPEHFTVDTRLDGLVMGFIKSQEKQR